LRDIETPARAARRTHTIWWQ